MTLFSGMAVFVRNIRQLIVMGNGGAFHELGWEAGIGQQRCFLPILSPPEGGLFLVIPLTVGRARWPYRVTYLQTNVQIFHLSSSLWCSLVIFCLLMGFIWGPLCSQKAFFSLSAFFFFHWRLITPSFYGWQAVLCPSTACFPPLKTYTIHKHKVFLKPSLMYILNTLWFLGIWDLFRYSLVVPQNQRYNLFPLFPGSWTTLASFYLTWVKREFWPSEL